MDRLWAIRADCPITNRHHQKNGPRRKSWYSVRRFDSHGQGETVGQLVIELTLAFGLGIAAVVLFYGVTRDNFDNSVIHLIPMRIFS